MLDSLGDLRSIRWSFWRLRISDFSLLRVDLLIRPISRHITITSREATRLLPSCISAPDGPANAVAVSTSTKPRNRGRLARRSSPSRIGSWPSARARPTALGRKGSRMGEAERTCSLGHRAFLNPRRPQVAPVHTQRALRGGAMKGV
jgi:hypothetical protein